MCSSLLLSEGLTLHEGSPLNSLNHIEYHIVLEMDEDSFTSDPPTKWDLAKYIPYILSSNIEIRYPECMSHRPPIVTIEEIQNARNICPQGTMGGCLLLEINPSTILKVGLMAQMGEVEALRIMKKRTSVPVPEVFNAYTIAEIGFIVMSKIPGLPLNQAWEHLTRDAKESIVQQLSGFIQQWRQIEGPLFSSIDGGPCEDIFFHHPWDTPQPYGPFLTRKEFNEGVVKALGYSRPTGQLMKRDEPLAKKILLSGSKDNRKVFTHGDLHRSNIMVDGDTISGIIDFGAAGYSISGREYFCLRWQAWDFEWRDLISTILDTDEYEFWAEVNQSMIEYTGF